MPSTYDRIAPKYDGWLRPFERWFLTNLRKETIAAVPQHARILELGAGTGPNFSLYQTTSRLTATEPSWQMLQIATRKSTSVTLVQSYAEHLPFSADTFDAAVATLVMCSGAKTGPCVCRTEAGSAHRRNNLIAGPCSTTRRSRATLRFLQLNYCPAIRRSHESSDR